MEKKNLLNTDDLGMTAEMAFLNTQIPRRPPPRSCMYTGASVLGSTSAKLT
jgi:hypothetical protein